MTLLPVSYLKMSLCRLSSQADVRGLSLFLISTLLAQQLLGAGVGVPRRSPRAWQRTRLAGTRVQATSAPQEPPLPTAPHRLPSPPSSWLIHGLLLPVCSVQARSALGAGLGCLSGSSWTYIITKGPLGASFLRNVPAPGQEGGQGSH